MKESASLLMSCGEVVIYDDVWRRDMIGGHGGVFLREKRDERDRGRSVGYEDLCSKLSHPQLTTEMPGGGGGDLDRTSNT